MSGSVIRASAVLAAALLTAVAAFQLALAAGAPWGEMSYGGRAVTSGGVLSASYRLASAGAVVVLLLAAALILARVGLLPPGPAGPGFLQVATWVIAGYLVVNTGLNLLAEHPAERFGMGTVTLLAAVAAFVVARAPLDTTG